MEIGMPVLGVSINYRKGAWGMLYSIEIQVSARDQHDVKLMECESSCRDLETQICR